jgi:hypothetical protein
VGPLIVVHEDTSYDVEPEERLTFGRGRDCSIRIGRKANGAYDLRLSRDAGYFEALGPSWYVWATGNVLEVQDDLGGVTPVLRGKATSISRPYVVVGVTGEKRHELEVRYSEDALPTAVSYLPRRFDSDTTERPPDPSPSPRQKIVYVAKLAPMLEGRSANSLRATAAILRSRGDDSYSESAVRNLWAVWVAKCVEAGFKGLTRETGLEDLSSDRAMFLELRRRGLLSHTDLKVLPGSR